MKIPEEYKSQLRDLLSEIFSERTSFLLVTLSLLYELKIFYINGMLALSAPITFGDTLVAFIEEEEGLSVKEITTKTYMVSIEV